MSSVLRSPAGDWLFSSASRWGKYFLQYFTKLYLSQFVYFTIVFHNLYFTKLYFTICIFHSPAPDWLFSQLLTILWKDFFSIVFELAPHATLKSQSFSQLLTIFCKVFLLQFTSTDILIFEIDLNHTTSHIFRVLNYLI